MRSQNDSRPYPTKSASNVEISRQSTVYKQKKTTDDYLKSLPGAIKNNPGLQIH